MTPSWSRLATIGVHVSSVTLCDLTGFALVGACQAFLRKRKRKKTGSNESKSWVADVLDLQAWFLNRLAVNILAWPTTTAVQAKAPLCNSD
jgi:hypothetical protein